MAPVESQVASMTTKWGMYSRPYLYWNHGITIVCTEESNSLNLVWTSGLASLLSHAWMQQEGFPASKANFHLLQTIIQTLHRLQPPRCSMDFSSHTEIGIYFANHLLSVQFYVWHLAHYSALESSHSTFPCWFTFQYSQTSNTRCIKSQNSNVSRIVLQLSLPNPLKPGVKSWMKM